MAKKNLDSGLANLFGSTKTSEQTPMPQKTTEQNATVSIPVEKETKPTQQSRKVSTSIVTPESVIEVTEPAAGTPKTERTGKPKVLPDNFVRTNYIMDPEIIRKFKVIATMRGTSVNLLANEVIGRYVDEHFSFDTSR